MFWFGTLAENNLRNTSTENLKKIFFIKEQAVHLPLSTRLSVLQDSLAAKWNGWFDYAVLFILQLLIQMAKLLDLFMNNQSVV